MKIVKPSWEFTREPDGEDRLRQSGSKYLRKMDCLVDGHAGVYAVLIAFNVTCPATQQAIKKLLCAGIRGKGDIVQDLQEARDAISRALQMRVQLENPLSTLEVRKT